MIFKGTATALITPFTESGVDFDALDKLLDAQVAGGVSAVVVLGTTGEPATMTAAEKKAVIEFSVKKLKGVIPVIIGTGSNNTAAAVELSVQAEKLGADALLVVTPYYMVIVCTIEVMEIFKISKVGTVAGCIVREGKLTRTTPIRVIRDGIVIYTGRLGSLKRFKDDVKEVSMGQDCGLNIESYNDVRVGDIIEGYDQVEVKRTK